MSSSRKNEVFLSFRDTDTRRGFLSHLFKALCEKKIETFMDYKIREGNEISSAFLREIEESYISLVIFSKDYASSKWCLEELVKIIECKEKNGQIVVPIFYDIDPSSVRYQRGSYEDAFIEHEKKNYGTIKLQTWRAALKKAANLSGFHFSNSETEAELIEKVTQCVLIRLEKIINQSNLEGIVGIHQQITHVELLLRTWSQDVRIIGIWGMSGIGKTTIANIVFNNLCNDYEGCHFLENVREECEKYGITQLKNNLLTKLLGEDQHIIMHNGIPAYIKRRLCHKKVLVVLDDVTDSEQLQALTGGHDWFGPGSRIIMTSRDKHVLSQGSDEIYEVKALNFDEALELFNLNAFRGGHLEKEWSELSKRVVDFAKGIPSAIKILGSFLRGKGKEEKIEKMACLKIQNALRWSYDGLDEQEKDILLYLACFFKQCSKKRITTLLNTCGYSTVIGLRVLQDRALITISSEECISMHDLIQEMCLAIVHEKSSKDPSKRNHLWDPNDVYRVLKNNTGTDSIESIKLDMSRIKELHLRPRAFSGMVNLKFLEFTYHTEGDSDEIIHKVHLPQEGLESLSNELRSFHWKHYPLTSFPLTFCAENLVEFYMPNSCVKKLWDGIQDLVNLKEIDLSNSPHLMELPDLSKAQNLESVNLSSCFSLQHLHPSILSNNKLIKLNLFGCKKLNTLRSENSLKSLRHLTVQGCSSLKDFSVISEKMTYLNLSDTAIEELYSSIGNLNKLEVLHLGGCQYLKSLPLEVSELRSLKCLNLSNCRRLETWNLRVLLEGLRCLEDLSLQNCCNLIETPDNISLLSSLTVLSLSGTNIDTLPTSIRHLSKLKSLNLRDCKMLRSLPELPSFISHLDASNCTSLKRVFTSDPTNDTADQPVDSECESDFLVQNCKKLEEHALEAIVAENLNLRIKQGAFKHISASSWGYLNCVCFPGSKVPDCFSYRSTKENLMLPVTLELPLNSRLMGFVFCIVHPQMQSDEQGNFFRSVSFRFYLEEHCNGGRLEFVSSCPNLSVTDTICDHAYMWYDGDLSLEIMNGTERRRALDTGKCIKVSFQFILGVEAEFVGKIREWGICPVYVSESQNQQGSKSKRTGDVDDLQLSKMEDMGKGEEDLHQRKKLKPVGTYN